jgi:hypothetical protein
LPQTEWYIFSYERAYGYESAWARIFIRTDLRYFLFNPPGDSDHPTNITWQINYRTWFDAFVQGTLTPEMYKDKYDAVIEALNLWEAGGSRSLANLTEAQRGYVKVFHPLYQNSPWNHPSECLEMVLDDTTTKSFCRFRHLINDYLYLRTGVSPQYWESYSNSFIVRELHEGLRYAQVLDKFHTEWQNIGN